MKCVMCPRTIYMSRKNIWISDEIFEEALSNIKTYNEDKLNDFWKWLESNTLIIQMKFQKMVSIFLLFQSV